MKKTIALILAIIVVISGMFAACSGKEKIKGGDATTTTKTTTMADEYILDTEVVTDANGEAVTDKQGNTVTTMAQYTQVTDKNGKKLQVKIDSDGKPVTDKSGSTVTRATTQNTTKIKDVTDKDGKPVTDKNGNKKTTIISATNQKTSRMTTTAPSKKPTSAITGGASTSSPPTTLPVSDDTVPKTSAAGKDVSFSAQDQQTIQNMLEVPYLYNASYENSDGVPINIAAHAAIWMAQREGLNTTTFASGTISLDLFNFFGQTVVNFKLLCNKNKDEDCSIRYNSKDDSFTIKGPEDKKQTVRIQKIQSVGNNNYYKVVASVSGAGSKKKVVAIIQRNQLDSSLGFSIKALKWS